MRRRTETLAYSEYAYPAAVASRRRERDLFDDESATVYEDDEEWAQQR